jgi:hypothetical protein
MDITVWMAVGVIFVLLLGAFVALMRRRTRDDHARGPVPKPETPGDGIARARPGLPGEPDAERLREVRKAARGT